MVRVEDAEAARRQRQFFALGKAGVSLKQNGSEAGVSAATLETYWEKLEMNDRRTQYAPSANKPTPAYHLIETFDNPTSRHGRNMAPKNLTTR